MNWLSHDDPTRPDMETADILRHAVSINHSAGVVAAWAFLSGFDLPSSVILRVLSSEEQVRRELPRLHDAAL